MYSRTDVYILFIFFLMIRRPPRSTRTDTLLPYTTLFRSIRKRTCDHLIPKSAGGPNLYENRVAACMECNSAKGSTDRSEEHTSELQSLMRISYAVFCLNKKTT